MADEIITPEVSVEPVDQSDTELAAQEEDNEYKAALAKARGKKEEEEKELTYEEAMAKAKGESEEDQDEQPEDKKPEDKKPEDKKPSRKWKLKVNGADEEVDETELVRRAQLSSAADKKFQQAAQIRKQAEQFIQALKSDPARVLGHPAVGVDLRKFAEEYLYNVLQKEMKSPEEQARDQEKEELEQYRQREEERKQNDKTQQRQELEQKYRADWNKKFVDALEQSGVPKTPWTVSQMANYMRQAIRSGLKHIQPSDVVSLVKKDWIKAQNDLLSTMDGDKLIEILGKETVDKIRKANLARFNGSAPKKPAGQSAKKQSSSAPRYSSAEEMRDYLMARNRK